MKICCALLLLLSVAARAEILVHGINSDVDTAHEDVVAAEGNWVPFTSAQTVVFSGGASDDANHPSRNSVKGADTVLVVGLNALYKPIQNRVALNGTDTAGVVSDSSFIAVNSIEVVAAGGQNFNAGAVTCYARTDQTAQAAIPLQHNRSADARYTVPAGRGMTLVDWFGSLGQGVITGAVDLTIAVRDSAEFAGFVTIDHMGIAGPGSSHVGRPVNISVPPRAAIKIRAIASLANTDVIAGFRLKP